MTRRRDLDAAAARGAVLRHLLVRHVGDGCHELRRKLAAELFLQRFTTPFGIVLDLIIDR